MISVPSSQGSDVEFAGESPSVAQKTVPTETTKNAAKGDLEAPSSKKGMESELFVFLSLTGSFYFEPSNYTLIIGGHYWN